MKALYGSGGPRWLKRGRNRSDGRSSAYESLAAGAMDSSPPSPQTEKGRSSSAGRAATRTGVGGERGGGQHGNLQHHDALRRKPLKSILKNSKTRAGAYSVRLQEGHSSDPDEYEKKIQDKTSHTSLTSGAYDMFNLEDSEEEEAKLGKAMGGRERPFQDDFLRLPSGELGEEGKGFSHSQLLHGETGGGRVMPVAPPGRTTTGSMGYEERLDNTRRDSGVAHPSALRDHAIRPLPQTTTAYPDFDQSGDESDRNRRRRQRMMDTHTSQQRDRRYHSVQPQITAHSDFEQSADESDHTRRRRQQMMDTHTSQQGDRRYHSAPPFRPPSAAESNADTEIRTNLKPSQQRRSSSLGRGGRDNDKDFDEEIDRERYQHFRKSKLEKIRQLQATNKSLWGDKLTLESELAEMNRQLAEAQRGGGTGRAVSPLPHSGRASAPAVPHWIEGDDNPPPLEDSMELDSQPSTGTATAARALSAAVLHQHDKAMSEREHHETTKRELDKLRSKVRHLERRRKEQRVKIIRMEKDLSANGDEIVYLQRQLATSTEFLDDDDDDCNDDGLDVGGKSNLKRFLTKTSRVSSDAAKEVDLDQIEVLSQELASKNDEIVQVKKEMEEKDQKIKQLELALQNTRQDLANSEKKRLELERSYEVKFRTELERTRKEMVSIKERNDTLQERALQLEQRVEELEREKVAEQSAGVAVVPDAGGTRTPPSSAMGPLMDAAGARDQGQIWRIETMLEVLMTRDDNQIGNLMAELREQKKKNESNRMTAHDSNSVSPNSTPRSLADSDCAAGVGVSHGHPALVESKGRHQQSQQQDSTKETTLQKEQSLDSDKVSTSISTEAVERKFGQLMAELSDDEKRSFSISSPSDSDSAAGVGAGGAGQEPTLVEMKQMVEMGQWTIVERRPSWRHQWDSRPR